MKKLKKKEQKRLFIQICVLITLMNIPALVTGTINFVDIKVMKEDAKIKIDFITDKAVIKYNSFTLDKPPSIVIDIQNTQCTERELSIGSNGVNRISLIPQEGPNTRAVINLIKLLPYQIQELKNGIEVIIDNPYHGYQLTAIDVKEDESKISLSISSTSPPQYKYFDLSNPTRIIIDFLNATNKIGETRVISKVIKNIIPSQRQVDPVKVARVIVELTEFMPYKVFSDENQVILELTKYPIVKEVEKVAPPKPTLEVLPKVKEAPPIVKEAPAKVKKEEKPEIEKRVVKEPPEPKPALPEVKPKVREVPTLSLDFKDADILDVLRLIAHKVGMNVLPGKDVKGVVTVRLDDVPWQKALDLILKNLGYAYIIDDNIIRVDTPTVLLGDTTTRIFRLNYAKAKDMTPIVTNMMTTLSNQQAKRMGGITPVLGTVIEDARTNALIVTDIPYNVNQIEEIIKKLDTMTPQVMIEAKIVELILDTRNMFGFKWSVEDKRHHFTLGSYQTEGWAMGDRGEFLYSKITTGHELDLQIQALVSEGKANVLSTPKILALDNEKAEIIVGEDIPYQQTTTSEAGVVQTGVSFLQVGIKLAVTPHINPDNFILLEVKPEVSSLKEWAYGMPVVTTKEATSKLVVKDGETMVIGGIIDDQGTEKLTKVPFFGDLPFVAPLFRKKLTENRKIELLIFITPYIKKYA
ncbi:MAG: AMIN domain-containing protein [bacterium]